MRDDILHTLYFTADQSQIIEEVSTIRCIGSKNAMKETGSKMIVDKCDMNTNLGFWSNVIDNAIKQGSSHDKITIQLCRTEKKEVPPSI